MRALGRPEEAVVERSTEIEALVVAWFESASRGDPRLVDRHVSPDAGTILVGSDPDEVLRGGPAVADFLRGEVAAAGGNATFTPRDVTAFREGSVGWVTALLTITLPDGRHVSPRWSAVMHLEDGIWCFVQTHASIGVPNDRIGWVYPA
jgi:ketosteroid isomerase-like protein